MNLDPNFSEFIALLRAHDARFLIVGGYAVAFHGHPRYTGDLDVWLLTEADNARAVLAALEDFGFGGAGLGVEDFTLPDHVVPGKLAAVQSAPGASPSFRTLGVPRRSAPSGCQESRMSGWTSQRVWKS